MPLAHSHRLRRGRCSEPGRCYLLTAVTHERQPLFHDLRSARLLVKQLRLSDQENASRTLAWVLMPDHLHWLIELRGVTLGSLMRRFKSRSAITLRKSGVRHVPIWQPGYHDAALRKEEDVLQAARYIIANPLRAGLVSSVREYPHWDAVWL
ncbi:transposase [Pseudomonas sp. MNR3A]|uniref:REP-associated tyrosine transposase n=1 Tax=Pseudomonas sp. MNR3A TaxID=2615213 RepID=UPI00129B75B3|nr:transposase [Pseudomonas sp. MNR3A]